MATARCTAYRAVELPAGVVVGEGELGARVGYLLALVKDAASGLVAGRWTPADLDALTAGVGLDGRVLPAKGYMAMRRLGWSVAFPDGVYVSDRVRRCAEEEAARALRLAVHRRSVVAAIIASWPVDSRKRTEAEWAALRALLPEGVLTAEIRNRTRQVRAFADAHQGRVPGDLTELEDPPGCAGQVLLAAADRQLVTVDLVGAGGVGAGGVGAGGVGAGGVEVRVQLPLVASPGSARAWECGI